MENYTSSAENDIESKMKKIYKSIFSLTVGLIMAQSLYSSRYVTRVQHCMVCIVLQNSMSVELIFLLVDNVYCALFGYCNWMTLLYSV